MKKKAHAGKKKPAMPEFEFKEFTAEENRVYEESVNRLREQMAAGKTLRQAYESVVIENKDLEKLIQADFLKIMIAERHYGQRQALEDVARALDVPLDLLKDTNARMLQEAGVAAANDFGREFGDLTSDAKTND